jgi:hypothetical protein
MDLGNVAARELYESRSAVVRREGFDQHARSCSSSLGESHVEIGNLVARELPAIRVWEVSVGDQHRHSAERRFDAHSSVRLVRPANLNPGSRCEVADDLSLGERDKVADEGVSPIGGHVDTILGDRCQGG